MTVLAFELSEALVVNAFLVEMPVAKVNRNDIIEVQQEAVLLVLQSVSVRTAASL